MKKLNILFMCVLCANLLANSKFKKAVYTNDSVPKLIVFSEDTFESSEDSKNVLKKYLKLSKDDNFKLKKDKIDKRGTQHQKYNHFYKGLKVEFSEYIVHSKNGKIKSINGNITKGHL